MTESSPRKPIFKKNIIYATRWFGMMFIIIFTWIFLLQIAQLGKFAKMGSGRNDEDVIRHQRGRILDRNGKTLAIDDVSVSVYCDPVMVTFPGESRAETMLDPNASYSTQSGAIVFVIKHLAPIFGWKEEDLYKEITRIPEFVWVKRSDITPVDVTEIRSYNMPGLKVAPDGRKYYIEFDVSKFTYTDGIADSIGKIIDLPVPVIEKELGVIPDKKKEYQQYLKIHPEKNPIAQDKKARLFRLSETATTIERKQIEDLRLAGIGFVDAGQNISLGCYTRAFRGINPIASIDDTAAMLAPILNMEVAKLKRALQGKLRYVSIKKNLSDMEHKKYSELQASIFVVKPGKIFETMGNNNDDPREKLAKAAERLYRLIHNLKKDDPLQPRAGKPELISLSDIIAKLSPGATPGKMVTIGEKAKNSEIILPIKRLILSLENKPIPGVVYGLPGVKTEEKMVREYPYNSILSQTLGYMEQTGKYKFEGVFGLEKWLEPKLAGIDGKEIQTRDGRGNAVPGTYNRIDPIDGKDVTTTIDINIQEVAEDEITKSVKEHKAKGGICVVLNPKNGEILAMASTPSWDANKRGEYKGSWVNPIISNVYEPGSTFKLMITTAALDTGKIRPGQQFINCTGALSIAGGRPIHEAHNAHGAVDAKRLMEQSCNLGAALLAYRMGYDKTVEWARKFGFTQRTGLEKMINSNIKYQTEAAGRMPLKEMHERGSTLAQVGFGQSITITPLQLAAAYAAIANEGVYIAPHLLSDKQLETQPETHRICKKTTAKLMMDYMENCVMNGTGTAAAIPGYKVGGKTGTAQKAVSGFGYSKGLHVGSFCGIMPMDNPQLVIVAVVDEPTAGYYGGVVAAPVVQVVGEKALKFMNILPRQGIGIPPKLKNKLAVKKPGD